MKIKKEAAIKGFPLWTVIMVVFVAAAIYFPTLIPIALAIAVSVALLFNN